MSKQNPRFSLQNDRKIDGYGLRVAQIGTEVVDGVSLALYLYHGDLAKAGVSGYCPFRCRGSEPCPNKILTSAYETTAKSTATASVWPR